MNTVPTVPPVGEDHPHFKLISGLMQLAGFLAGRPDVPVDSARLYFYAQGTDSDKIAQVRQIGHLLDAEPSWTPNHFVVTRQFGPVEYQAGAIPEQQRRDYLRINELAEQALAAEKAAAAAAAADTVELQQPVEVVVVVDPPAAAPVDVDEGQADGEPELRTCPVCEGDPSSQQFCRGCFGSGKVLPDPPKCAGCAGTGRAVDEFCIATMEPCQFCAGTGYQERAAATW